MAYCNIRDYAAFSNYPANLSQATPHPKNTPAYINRQIFKKAGYKSTKIPGRMGNSK